MTQVSWVRTPLRSFRLVSKTLPPMHARIRGFCQTQFTFGEFAYEMFVLVDYLFHCKVNTILLAPPLLPFDEKQGRLVHTAHVEEKGGATPSVQYTTQSRVDKYATCLLQHACSINVCHLTEIQLFQRELLPNTIYDCMLLTTQ